MSKKPADRKRMEAKAVAAYRATGSKTLAARALGVPRTTLTDWLTSAGVPTGERSTRAVPDAAATGAAGAKELLRMSDRLRTLEAELKESRRTELTTETVKREIIGLAASKPNPPEWVMKTEHSGSGPGTPILLVSDVHWNEVVRSQEVNGINRYDKKTQEARMVRAGERVIDLCFNHVANPKYDGIVVMLGGDIVSGDIHDELELNNAAESIPTAIDVADHLITLLTVLAARFGRVFVVTCYGNHGRQHKQYRFKRHAYQSYDWLTYQLVARHFAASELDVKFFIPDGPDALVTVAGRRYLLTHGDNLGVRGGDGIIGSLGPIRRGAIKVQGQYSSLNIKYDTIVMGHWHQLIMLDDIIVNGSGIGYSEYSRFNRFPVEAPRYALWGTHPKWGISYRYSVNLEEGVSGKVGSEWVKWNAQSS